MIKPLLSLAALLALAAPLAAQEGAQEAPPSPAPSPGEIVAAAPAGEWIAIAPEDLLVMTLAPDAAGKARQVTIQLMPAPFSQGWTANIRALARSQWYDGIAVTRVQDNYVAQWGDPEGEDPAKAKPLPAGLRTMTDADYVRRLDAIAQLADPCAEKGGNPQWLCDSYAPGTRVRDGWPLASDGATEWPVHCYGMVGVGRGYAPDTGTGAELYAVIGHAPRHLDRNIALVGRVVEGIEHLSSLPRGTGPLGFYESAGERVPILSVRVAADLPESERPRFQYLDTAGASFARYADARANRRDPFFNVPAGGADVCNIPVPVRRVPAS